MKLRVGSLASGIGGDAVAWHPLGWATAFFAEIKPFASAVLAHRFPKVPNLGDFTATDFCDRARALGEVDILAAGTPCQAFSVAGKRGSLSDERGNLTLRFVEVVHELDPATVVWENVPGVLSTADDAFGCFLAGMVGASEPLASGLERGRWPNAGMVVGPRRTLAWRVLDAQYCGLAQRRRRVCVVSFRTRNRTNPGAVLFEPESVRRDSTPSREEGADVTQALTGRLGGGGPDDNKAQGNFYVAVNGRQDPVPGEIPGALDGDGQSQCVAAQCHGSNIGPMGALRAGNGNETGGVPFVAFSCKDHGVDAGELAPTLRAMTHDKSHANAGGQVAVAFDTASITSRENRANPKAGDPSPTLAKGAPSPVVALTCGDRGISPDQAAGWMVQPSGAGVRRLTPRECERLQGFPDDWTLVPYRGRLAERCADGPRYRTLGNAWAVPVFQWIGRRIAKVLTASHRDRQDTQDDSGRSHPDHPVHPC